MGYREDRLQILIADAFRHGECLLCALTPSQTYANIKGYGRAHRFVWEVVNGPIPLGMLICHSCDEPRCINIDHLFLGSPQDNMDDKVAKGRQAFGGPGKYLSLEHFGQVVRDRYEGKTYEQIGNRLLVSRRTIKRFLESCPHD